MNALTRYLTDLTQAKTGIGGGVLVGYATQAVLTLATAVLGLIVLFFVFTDWLGFGPTATSIGMFLTFGALLMGAIFWTNSTKKRTVENAQRALRARKAPVLLSPPLLTAGMRVGQAVGWRRFVPVALVTLVATGVATEWARSRNSRGRDR
jgi:uncharacterized membrane protein